MLLERKEEPIEDFYIAAHAKLIEQYMNEHPSATWKQAREITVDRAFEHCVERLAEIADGA